MIFDNNEDKYFIRLEKGEEILTSLYKIIKKENINAGWINGIGAVEEVEIVSYDLTIKKYLNIKLDGVYEVTSLMGNIAYKDGEPFLHLHVILSDYNGVCYGGHLNKAKINATGEFFINSYDKKVTREYDSDIGLHLLRFHNDGK